jgi:hypothetical protein
MVFEETTNMLRKNLSQFYEARFSTRLPAWSVFMPLNPPAVFRNWRRYCPKPLNDDALGQALDTLYAYGVTELDSLLAATAAERLGGAPHVVHPDTTSRHVDGHDNSDEAPEAQVVHITQGYSRDHRPDFNPLMLALLVEHHAGSPLLMQPRGGNSRDTQEFGEAVRRHGQQVHAPDGPTSLVADRALSSEAHLEQLAQTQMQGITRVPATLREAQVALAQADPQAMVALQAGDRADELTSTDGGVAQRWVLIDSEPRRAQAQRTVDTPWRWQGDQEVNALKPCCGLTCACEANGRQTLAPFAPDLQATCLGASPARATPRDGKQGRPGQGVQPEQMVSQIAGGLASSRTARQALIAQHSCRMLATNALDATQWPPQQLLAGDEGQTHGEWGGALLEKSRVLGLLALPENTRADQGPRDGDERGCIRVCRPGVPHSTGASGA